MKWFIHIFLKKSIVCLILGLLILIFGNSLIAQNLPGQIAHFTYDANGNRIKRWVEVLKITKADSADSLHQDSLVKNNITHFGNLSKTVSLYPNPTQGLLDLKITGMKDGETAEYVFISLTGQELIRKQTGTPITRIDISNFPSGSYFVTVTIGKRVEIWKVIKQ